VFAALEEEAVKAAVIPIENSLATRGSVLQAYSLCNAILFSAWN
jgi:prephenate dehydratase